MASKTSVKDYQDQEVIFSEGDPSTFAYVVVKGRVELSKNSKYGPVMLASLKSGELFGEMGLIDGSPRSATARASGPTTLKEIPPDTFIEGVKNDPKLSSKVMGKLVERLRTADDMLAKAGLATSAGGQQGLSTATTPLSKPKKPGFLSRLFGSAAKGRTQTFEILIADFFDDEETKATALFHQTLSQALETIGFNEVSVRRTHSPFALPDFADSPLNWDQMRANASQWLTEEDGDLLIWGQVRSHGQMVHLRFAHRHPRQDLRAGYVDTCDGLDLPSELDDVLSGFLFGSALSAIVPFDKKQSDIFSEMVPVAMEAMRAGINKRLRDFGPDEKLRFDIAFANALATSGLFTRKTDFFKESEDVLLKSEVNLRRSKSALLPGIHKRHLGLVRKAWSDLGGPDELIEAAIESFDQACSYFTQANFPLEWGDLQTMKGQLLYKMDQKVLDGRALEEAVSAYQNALKVFSSAVTPQRWGDAKHHLARALQLLGSQRGDLSLIARSAETCREALLVRTKSQTPMLWAATQNNLGSALFMLCQKTRKPETAEAAVLAFQSALDFYEARGLAKLASVTQKNLNRAKMVADEIGPPLKQIEEQTETQTPPVTQETSEARPETQEDENTPVSKEPTDPKKEDPQL